MIYVDSDDTPNSFGEKAITTTNDKDKDRDKIGKLKKIDGKNLNEAEKKNEEEEEEKVEEEENQEVEKESVQYNSLDLMKPKATSAISKKNKTVSQLWGKESVTSNSVKTSSKSIRTSSIKSRTMNQLFFEEDRRELDKKITNKNQVRGNLSENFVIYSSIIN